MGLRGLRLAQRDDDGGHDGGGHNGDDARDGRGAPLKKVTPYNKKPEAIFGDYIPT